ncbi:MAG TPA: globin family protein [Phenylobacterium sp.]|nr:globin family protein [Phenylobacterium sp.]
MTPDKIALVKSSFAEVAKIAEPAAGLFYGRLFEVAPSVQHLFKGDLTAQGRKLMAALAMVVGSLDRMDQILPQVEHMARRHVAYGAEEAHYAVVGDTLIWTLEQGLGDAFTPAVRQAWAEAYAALSGAMIAAARTVEAPAA